jgi:hypothetical protein
VPTTVTARAADTLCNLAIAAGFLNCQALRDEPANSALLTRPLQDGDVVTIPDLRPRGDAVSTDRVHRFSLRTAPPVSIRFVHGSPDRLYLQDTTTTLLNISNFVTRNGGANGRGPFPREFEFHQPGHDDPDAFKIEVVDPAAGASVRVLLEAMKPVYVRDPATRRLTVTGHVEFTGGDKADRSVTLDCRKVRSRVSYRSKYVRLVTDEKNGDPHPGDKQAVGEQTLLVTDMADGNGTGQPGDNDSVEILDQEVRATYFLQRCPAAAPNQCAVRVQLPIGGDERRRLRVAYHVFRTSRGGPAVGGASDAQTLQAVRFRTFKWLRRVMAQANIGPKLMSVELLDPPQPNMIVISPDTGSAPSGLSIFGPGRFGTGESSLSLALSPLPPAQTFASTVVNVNLNQVAFPRAPVDVGNALIAALPAGFSGALFVNPRAFNAINGSCDVIITRADGALVAIGGETVDDNNLDFQIAVPRIVGTIHPQGVGLGPVLRTFAEEPREAVLANTADVRCLIRATPGSDDVMDVYVVDFLENRAGEPFARGIACLRGREVRAGFESRAPMRNCLFLGRSPDPAPRSGIGQAHPAVDLTDFNYHTLPHETGHVLGDFGHPVRSNPPSADQTFHNNTDLMGVGPGREFNAVDHPKRIPDGPVFAVYQAFDPTQANPGDAANRSFNVVERMRTEGAGLLESW